MPEEPTPSEMDTSNTPDPVMGTETAPTTTTPTPAAETVSVSKAEWEKMQRALKDANKEAADRRKRLEELEKAEKDRQDAALTEQEKKDKRLAELESELAKVRFEALQRRIAAEVGLPEAFAGRIHGNDEDAMRADAKTLAEALPKPAAPKSPEPKILATNPGAGGSQKPTDDQLHDELFGGPSRSMFAPDRAKANGGGVVIREKNNGSA